MQKFNLAGSTFCFEYQDHWVVEYRDDLISLYSLHDGVGVLQFSFYVINKPQNVFLNEIFQEFLEERHEKFDIKFHEKSLFTEYIQKDDSVWKYWLFLKGSTMVFSSYNCSFKDLGKENDEITDIINSALSC